MLEMFVAFIIINLALILSCNKKISTAEQFIISVLGLILQAVLGIK